MNPFILVAAFLLSIPSSAYAWSLFGPGSYAECVTEAMKDQENKDALRYARSHCYNEHCKGKGHYKEVDNSKTIEWCKEQRSTIEKNAAELRALVRQIKNSDCDAYSISSACRRLIRDRNNAFSKRFGDGHIICDNIEPVSRRFVYDDSTCNRR